MCVRQCPICGDLVSKQKPEDNFICKCGWKQNK